jgi:CBS domain-containing protein
MQTACIRAAQRLRARFARREKFSRRARTPANYAKSSWFAPCKGRGMARVVEEIMNPELVCLRPSDTAEEAIARLLGMGVSGAPVVDAEGYPLGVVSFRDLLPRCGGPLVMHRMTSPAVTIERMATVEAAARLLSERAIHRAVVTDDRGAAAGLVSTLDVMRALCGIPTRHPPSFPHRDLKTGLTFSDDQELSPESVQLAPQAPGILVLRVGGPGHLESDVWLEATADLRARLRDILLRPHDDRRLFELVVRHGSHLRFRVAEVLDPERLSKALEQLKTDRPAWVHVPSP